MYVDGPPPTFQRFSINSGEFFIIYDVNDG